MPSSDLSRVGLSVLCSLALSPLAHAQQPAARSTSKIVGVVVNQLGAPVRDAIAVLDSVRYRQTDARGRFQFDSLSPGTHRLDVRSIGYNPLTASLEVGEGTADAIIKLKPGAHRLPELFVRARQAHLEEIGFYQRRAEQYGRFLEADTILRLDSVNLLQGLSRLPGFRARTLGALDPDVASHACQKGFLLWLNGWEVADSGDKAFFLRTLHPRDLDGVEIYEDATAPLIFTGHLPRSCVLAIWERR